MMKNPQSDDIQVANSPSDGIASLSLNGNITSPSTMLIAGAWDSTVSCYVLQYDNQNKLVQANAQAQIKHDAPVLCTDIASVCDKNMCTSFSLSMILHPSLSGPFASYFQLLLMSSLAYTLHVI